MPSSRYPRTRSLLRRASGQSTAVREPSPRRSGRLLSVLAKVAGAKAVVEVGTGAGVSGLWLLSGMRDDGVLTTIDVEPEHQRLAKQAFSEAGIGPSRTRLIGGRAQDVLTRLADDSYDLVFIDAEPLDQPDFVAEGVRLLRSGGAIVVHRAALGGRAGDAGASGQGGQSRSARPPG